MNVKKFYHTNQFIIMGDGALWLQSYDSTVAKLQGGVLTLGKNWDYSNTTLRHLYKFIEEYCNKSLWDEIRYSNNKSKTINALIKYGVIEYDSDMR